ncbi:MAG: nucleoside deaminase, partial [Deltaproteobacteria bacterium]|nr:nucleoside deaminase [Deltaproteobacteria bacterium]
MDDEFFMLKALGEAEQALSMGEFPVGCVLVYNDSVLVTGARYHSTPDTHNELDHAEMLALRRLVDLEKEIDRERVILFSTLQPCLMCYSAIILNGIRQIVYAYEDVMGGGTNLDLKRLNPFYQDMQISVKAHVLRERSLAFFKTFFADSKNTYLKGSLLAEYT